MIFDNLKTNAVFKYNGNILQKTEKQSNGNNAKNQEGKSFFISPARQVTLINY